MKRLLVAALLLAAVTACSQSNSSAGGAASSAPGAAASPEAAATNDTGFPLYADAKVMSSSPLKVARGANVLTGKEVIAETDASMADLGKWVKDLGTTPPAGYTVAASGSGMEQARARAQALGIDFQAFSHTVGGKQRGVIVVAIDPAKFNEKAKPILSLIGKYKMLPQALRDPIDAQVKAKTGYTMSDSLSPGTPIGAAIAAADELKNSGQRAIVIVDGAKE